MIQREEGGAACGRGGQRTGQGAVSFQRLRLTAGDAQFGFALAAIGRHHLHRVTGGEIFHPDDAIPADILCGMIGTLHQA
ncbi:Uncharacterised protein [Pantoea agglomerans]|uniref:Uncharacterized protein n=1 Tax=Enterobacter agglomerans TaxID=549 RepID=A0A379ABX2_ENTAG|nr:Uncharacterised protein [Pantoea agglomerans]